MFNLVGKLLYFTILGFLALTVVPTVMGLVASVLPFALVGGLVWWCYKGFTKPNSNQAFHPLARSWKQTREATVKAFHDYRKPIGEATTAMAGSVNQFKQSASKGFWRLKKMAMESFCGAAVAGLVALTLSWGGGGFSEEGTLVAAGLGGLVGLLVGLTVPESGRQTREWQVADGR
ncbi:MAG: hypothetical protein ACKO23_04305 [Gemmataceae bacterium]